MSALVLRTNSGQRLPEAFRALTTTSKVKARIVPSSNDGASVRPKKSWKQRSSSAKKIGWNFFDLHPRVREAVMTPLDPLKMEDEAEAQQAVERYSKYAWDQCYDGPKFVLSAVDVYISLAKESPDSDAYLVSIAMKKEPSMIEKERKKVGKAGNFVFSCNPRQLWQRFDSFPEAVRQADALLERRILNQGLLAAHKTIMRFEPEPASIPPIESDVTETVEKKVEEEDTDNHPVVQDLDSIELSIADQHTNFMTASRLWDLKS
ncbi:hypothetical protein QFC21_002074 [Naganishia friedmannii]|uniref:Uncharacterized protein n=1 Tax=Naganishia friedmannii TaxID=89922 RepID=A0ACC2W138_9TREE|nr:hypothetical protein QFC21_002074 [Naganishia friedmannii]